jgi:hypothetical protein
VRVVRGRLAAVSVRAALTAGIWVGFVLGVVVGSFIGVLIVWLAGTILDWQRDLGFTLGVARALLPLGDQIGALRWISVSWWAVIPLSALVIGIVGAAMFGFAAALLAAAYNRTPRHAGVLVELPDEERPLTSMDPS